MHTADKTLVIPRGASTYLCSSPYKHQHSQKFVVYEEILVTKFYSQENIGLLYGEKFPSECPLLTGLS